MANGDGDKGKKGLKDRIGGEATGEQPVMVECKNCGEDFEEKPGQKDLCDKCSEEILGEDSEEEGGESAQESTLPILDVNKKLGELELDITKLAESAEKRLDSAAKEIKALESRILKLEEQKPQVAVERDGKGGVTYVININPPSPELYNPKKT